MHPKHTSVRKKGKKHCEVKPILTLSVDICFIHTVKPLQFSRDQKVTPAS